MSDARFEVSAEGMLKLKAGVSVDAAREQTIRLQVQATDSGGWVCTENFTLQVQIGTGNARIATPSDSTQGGIATPSTADSGGSFRSSGGSSSGASSNSGRSLGLVNSRASSNPYSYINTNGKIYNHGNWKQVGSIWKLDVDGSPAKSAWAYLDEKWYLFNDRGEMVTGWANVDGSRYFMDSSGVMHYGWMTDEKGEWYYLNPVSDGTKGAMRYGWVADEKGEWYYLNPVSDGTEGVMRIGWQQIDSKWYYLNPVSDGTKGKMLKSQRTPDGYLLKADGSLDESIAKE